MANLGAGEWLIILLVVLLLFGSAKLPSLARSLGKSARILKAETKGLHEDDDQSKQQAQHDPRPAQQGQFTPTQGQQGGGAYGQQQPGHEQGQLPPGRPIQGVPVDPDQVHKSG